MTLAQAFWWGLWPLLAAGVVLLADRYWRPHDSTPRPGKSSLGSAMAIVTYHFRRKRPPRKKRKQPAIATVIVTPAPLRPLKGPVIRLGQQAPAEVPSETKGTQPKRSAIAEPKQKPRPSIFGPAPDDEPEAHLQAGERAEELWRELVRKARGDG